MQVQQLLYDFYLFHITKYTLFLQETKKRRYIKKTHNDLFLSFFFVTFATKTIKQTA